MNRESAPALLLQLGRRRRWSASLPWRWSWSEAAELELELNSVTIFASRRRPVGASSWERSGARRRERDGWIKLAPPPWIIQKSRPCFRGRDANEFRCLPLPFPMHVRAHGCWCLLELIWIQLFAIFWSFFCFLYLAIGRLCFLVLGSGVFPMNGESSSGPALSLEGPYGEVDNRAP
jgi:hypothetical protein